MTAAPQATLGTVLVVDDDDLFLRVCSAVLRRAGFVVEGLGDARHVVDTLKAGRFDAVVSDVRMPNVDGVELLKQIRSFDTLIPVVLMSGQPTIDAAMKAIELRALRLLQKPFDVDVLIDTVTQAIRSRWSTAPVALHAKLDRALATLSMVYQPIVRRSGQDTLAWEALARCKEGVENTIELITLAERINRIDELGRAVRDLVARDAEGLPEEALLFVNVHPRELSDPHLSSPQSPLSRLAPRVVLELTERATLEDVHGLPGKLAALRSLGFRLAVDDLGAGYSGLSTFARLEPEFVKLDHSLVRAIEANDRQQKVVASMIELSQMFGSQLIAEAIETPAERAALERLGVDWMQGFLFGRPAKPFVAGKKAA